MTTVCRFANKSVFVTGAASGIGAAIAVRFAREGAVVVVADRDMANGSAVAARLGGGAFFVALDVVDDDSWKEAMRESVARLGGIDILVNNAGITLPGSIETISVQDWRRTLDVDLTGVFLGCRHAIAAMKARGGAIINISSAYGLKADPDTVAYNAAKSAVVLMSKSIALHCARCNYGITCNTVHPGVIQTPMMEAWLAASPDPESEFAHWTGMHPLGRLGTPDEIAAAVAFLASDEARFITGTSIVVDGGLAL